MKKLLPWYAAAITLVIIFGTIYSVAQQLQRREANMPQIQIAEDLAADLNKGLDPKTAVSGHINMASSLAPFVMIYSQFGKPIAGNGYLKDKLPSIPLDSLVASSGETYSTVTWQPDNGVRIAAVTVAAKNYFVLSGRSLAEVEKNETNSLQLSALGGLSALLVLLILYGVLDQMANTNPKTSKKLG